MYGPKGFAVSRKTSGPLVVALFLVYYHRLGISLGATFTHVVTYLCLLYSLKHLVKDIFELARNMNSYNRCIEWEKEYDSTSKEKIKYTYKDGYFYNAGWLFFCFITMIYIILGLVISV